MSNPKNFAITGTTQELIPILDVIDDIVVLKDKSCALIIQVGAINFDLLSEEEQEAVIYAYSGLLNSLSFPIQIYIRSQKKDISNYLGFLDTQIKQARQSTIKQRLINYKNFITKLVKERRVLDKKFYLVIPYKNIEIPNPTSFNLFTFFNKSKTNQTPAAPHLTEIIEKAKTNLYPKRDHLIRQLAGIGLPARQLTTPEIIHLFHSIYNPQHPLKTTQSQQYRSTIVTSPS